MKSTSGEHYVALDHVRAIAAFIVFVWHFLHSHNGYPVPFGQAPAIFPMAILDEGHTGVALFMTLSGYLFAKLLDGKRIDFGCFIWNRALRLLPLLLLVCFVHILLVAVSGGDVISQLIRIAKGMLTPSLPNGGWSITVEFHFYLILPLLLFLFRKNKNFLIIAICCAMLVRTMLYLWYGEVQYLAYWTIIGRIDQFILGIFFFGIRGALKGKGLPIGALAIAFLLFYWNFDASGGFFHYPSYPSSKPLWIFMPTLEGLTYAAIIAWYDTSFAFSDRRASRTLAFIGELSFSMYLLHFFVVFRLSSYIHENILDITNFYLAVFMALVCFIALLPVCYLSYRFIERPFLRHRKKYILEADLNVTREAAVIAPATPSASR